MLIYFDEGSRECNNPEEILSTLKLRNEDSVNEFWISRETKYPCIALLVKDNMANVTYFPDDENHPGFIAVNDSVDSNEEVYIYVNCNEYYLDSENMIPFDDAVSAVLQFFWSHTRPDNLNWFEL